MNISAQERYEQVLQYDDMVYSVLTHLQKAAYPRALVSPVGGYKKSGVAESGNYSWDIGYYYEWPGLSGSYWHCDVHVELQFADKENIPWGFRCENLNQSHPSKRAVYCDLNHAALVDALQKLHS